MDNYNTRSFVIIHSMTNTVIPRTPFYGSEPSTLPLKGLKDLKENEEIHLKMPLSRKNVLSLMRNHRCSNVVPSHSVRKIQLKILLLSLTECITWSIFWTIISELAAGSVSKATPMGVPAPLRLFLYLKERWGWGVGGKGVWGKANSEGLNTQSKHYPMFELHTFSPTILPHTRALLSESYSC